MTTPARLGISMPGLTTDWHRFAELAKCADEAGFDTVWDYEFWRNPFMIQSGPAAATSDIHLGIGIAETFTRSPFEMANAALDLEEASNGRVRLGLGTGAGEWLEAFHSTDLSKPVSRMSEYLDVVRMSWEYLRTQDTRLRYEGEHYSFQALPFNPWGGRTLVRPRVPIYLAASRPKMLQLAGEKADGWLGFFSDPTYIKEVAIPNFRIGAERAGRDLADLELMSFVVCSVHDDRDTAMHRARIHVGQYAANPSTDSMVAHAGLEADRDRVREAMLVKGVWGAAEATSDALVDAFSITGTPDEARAKLKAFDSLLDQVILHTTYTPPLEAHETEDTFLNIVRTFGTQ